ncbi:prolyl oligopeptidase family serine peptidase [Brevibacillus ruminantium]|uniref:Prolyl oligopeptidase family serine peptidase n=1 Tax=Brevibacillus ruminantium TaxID=2950604 RepID=A0ABY4WSD1_9BACL|nr:prolyl oligopeptidase family serine peptidase [Brevibacillus ruminantium]USG68344.1 prolyl oligopeptidase family serine peptidase [Brevibacillus ruminantium]
MVAEPSVEPGIRLYTVSYESQGLLVKAALAVPEAMAQDDRLPALLYCRGGIKGVGKVRPERISQMAAFGYVVLAPHYRGNEGGEGRDEFGGADRHDVFAAYELLRSLSFVDRRRISVYGFSRGGIMALLAAIECEGLHSAVVWGGVSDLFLTYEERVDLRRMLRRVVGHPRKQEDAYKERSPVFRAAEVRCPVLIIHGSEDENVGVEHARRLADALQAAGKPYELWLAEGASHLFKGAEMERYTRQMFEWLDAVHSDQ